MKICITYPPIEQNKGVPLLSQNRQFQYFNSPTFIYPMIPASAATLLQKNGFEVSWVDGIAERLSPEKYLKIIEKEKPDLIVIESKTPVIKKHWEWIETLKKNFESKIVLVGDHVTALPEESFQKSKVDFILTGGDFDFLLLNLANHIEKNEKLEPGVWLRKGKKIINTGKFTQNHDLNSLPFIDRNLTKWWLYAYENGNFKRTPGTYTMAARDCWWRKNGGCTFCSWTTLYKNFQSRTPENLFQEIQTLVDDFHFKEIFDDSGTFPAGKWLEKFCNLMIESGYNKKVTLGCNMRVNALNQEQYYLMKKAGFRFLLYGVESASQETLDRINKGTKVEDTANACRMAKNAGLEPHLTVMFGYPWETKKEMQETVKEVKRIFNKGWADTLQATIVIPYPGTKLFEECKKNNWLKTLNWDDYDMRTPVMKTKAGDEEIKKSVQECYKVFMNPKYVLRKIMGIRSKEDLKFIGKGVKAVLGHLKDFSG